MEHDFKTKIYNASQTVNDFTQKIIDQKKVVKDVEYDVKRLAEAYKVSLKRNPFGATEQLSEYKAAKKALEEEKAALFGLTQQQAEARLSVKKLKDEYSAFREEAGETVQANEKMSLSLTKVLGIIGGVTALKGFASELIRVRGEFQSMETAIETLVGKDMANKLIPQIKELAKISPLTMSDMVGAEKMMLGFNIQAEDTIRYLQALSDISMGDSVKFNSLTLAFSQMSAAGKLMGQDLNQMINAGFNPLQVISEETGKSIATLKDEMSKGALSAEMVQQAFIDATSAGGKFYQMSENASKTINGQISMMQDALDAAFNEIGQASEGVIMKGIQATTSLIQNYETVGKVLIGLIATYGAYRAALMLATVSTSKHTIAEIALTSARVVARKAQMLLNAAMLTNPYVAVATVLAGLVTTMWAFHDSSTATEKATKNFNRILEENAQKQDEYKKKINELTSAIEDNTLSEGERLAAFEKLKAEYPSIFDKYLTEAEYLKEIAKYKRMIAEEDNRRANVDDREALRLAELKLQEYRNRKEQGVSLIDMNGNGWGETNVDKAIQAQLAVVNKAKAKVAELDVQSFLASIQFMKDERISSIINDIELSIKALSKSSDDSIAIVPSLGGEFSKTQLNSMKSALESEQKSRNNQTTYQQDLAAAKADWEKAKQGYEALIKDQKATSEQVKKAREDMEAKEKAYKELGGEVNKKKQIKGSSPFPKFEQNFYQDIEKQADAAEEDTSDTINDMVQTMLDGLDAEQEAMYKYLRNYGTFREQQRAITEEYSKKIAEAGGADTWQGKLLQKEMEQALSDIDLEKLKQGINWELVFGDLDKVSKESLNKVKQQLREFKNSDEYKNMAVDQKKVVDEALSNIQSTLIDKGGLLADLPEQLSELANAQEELAKAQEEYNEAMRSGTDEQKEAATKKLNDAQKRQQNAQVNVQKSTDKTTSNLVTLSNVITQLGSNSEISLSQVGDLAGNIVDIFAEESEKLGGIIGAAFSLLDAIGTQGLDGFVGNIFSSVFKSVGGIWDTLTFGGFSKLFGIGGNEKEVQDTINRLTDRNEKLQSAIESLTEEMKSSKGSEKSVAEYNKAIKYQEEYNKNVLSKAQANAGYHSKHHSWAYYMGWSESDIQWIRENVMAEFTGTDSLWQMSPEQMDLLRQNVDLWQKMADSGKGGYGNAVVDALGEYADLAGNLEELKEGLFEQLTGISFDSMYDSFIDTLMDMDASAEDFADNLSEYFMRAMISDKIGNMYSQKLEDWWNRFGESMKDGNLSESERNSLQNEYMGYVNEALKLRDELAAATGYDKAGNSSQQSASSRGFGTEMTHEDAGELSGRFTAVYESNLRIETAEQQQTVAITELRGSIGSLTSQVTGLYNIADETRTILANSYLELQQIRENTGEIVKPIKQIQADIAEVKRNTARL